MDGFSRAAGARLIYDSLVAERGAGTGLINRAVLPLVRETLSDTPITVLQGARQVGKSTLAKQLVDERGGLLVSLDDPVALDAATSDPDGFLETPAGFLAIDEAQRAPQLIRALKASVDRDRRPGRFLVTGSADLLDVPGVSDSLAGRAETVPLYGFSQGELAGRSVDFVTRVIQQGDEWIAAYRSSRARPEYLDLITAGGYPEAVRRAGSARERWFENYVQRIIRRDAAEVSRLQHLDRLELLLRLIAANNAGEMVQAHLARDAGIPETSLAPYIRLLENLYLAHRVGAWHNNLTKRVVSRPKLLLLDSGLAAHLAGQTPESLSIPTGSKHLGGLLEGFVAGELLKQRSWSKSRFRLHHFRDRDGAEVDLVVETARAGLIGVEVKAARNVSASDFKGLELVRDRRGERFRAGILLHLGEQAFSFGDRLWSLPVDALWAGE